MNHAAIATVEIDLGVNIDHVATLRNARGTAYPDPLEAALIAEQAGADTITLHLREDRRHIRDDDVIAIRSRIATRMNLECSLTPQMLDIACRVRPHDVCLVPERREELTTEGGLDIVARFEEVRAACARLGDEGIRTALFIDPEPEQIAAAGEAGAPVVELHTGRYADASGPARESELERVVQAAAEGRRQGLIVHAGHGLHYTNVQGIAAILDIAELNVGHAIVAHALFVGWANAVRQLKAEMIGARVATLRQRP